MHGRERARAPQRARTESVLSKSALVAAAMASSRWLSVMLSFFHQLCETKSLIAPGTPSRGAAVAASAGWCRWDNGIDNGSSTPSQKNVALLHACNRSSHASPCMYGA